MARLIDNVAQSLLQRIVRGFLCFFEHNEGTTGSTKPYLVKDAPWFRLLKARPVATA